MQNILQKPKVLVAGILILLLVVGLAVYFFGFKESATGTPSGGFFQGLFPGGGDDVPQPPTPPPSPSVSQDEIIQQISTEAGVRGVPQWTLIPLGNDAVSSLAAFGTTTRYHKNTPTNLGHLFERSKQLLGAENRISNLLLQQVARVVWSPQGTKAVIFYYDDDLSLRRFLIEYKGTSTPKTRFLDDEITSVAFSPDGVSLVYVERRGTSNNIFVADTAFKKVEKIVENNIPDLELSWPAKNTIAIKTKSSYSSSGFLYTVSTGGGLLNKIVGGLGLDAVWSKDALRALYSASNSGGKMNPAAIYDMTTKTSRQLPIATIAEKCTFGKKNPAVVYCGVPQSTLAGAYPDGWWQGKVSFQDSIVVIDVVSDRQIVSIPTTLDVINPVIFEDDSYLFFRDKTTDHMWALKLVDDSLGELPKTTP